MAAPARMKGPARTMVLLIPQCSAPALGPPATIRNSSSTTITATASSNSSPFCSSSSSAPTELMKGMELPKLLDPDCLEGLLGYAHLLFAHPQGGKLSVQGGAGSKMHTITCWDPGQQTLESIMKGITQWRVPDQEFPTLDLQLAIQEAVQLLFETPGTCIEEEKTQDKSTPLGNLQEGPVIPPKICVSEPWKAAQITTGRLIVFMAYKWGAGGSADIYHRMVLTALSKLDSGSGVGKFCDALFLDLSSTDANSNTCVCMQDADADTQLSTSFYKLPPACSGDLLLDLAYVHLELSAVAVKGLATTVKHTVNPGGNASALIKREDIKGSQELDLSSDTDLRLVLCQTSPMARAGGGCFTPTGGELRKSRTNYLFRVKRPIPKSQLFALPCTSVTPALLEVPFSRSSAQLWETVRAEEVDSEGHVVLALSSERDSMTVTHLLVWHLEQFWLHVLNLRNGSDATKGEAHYKLEELVHEKGAIRCQGTPLFPPDGMVGSIPGNISDDKPLMPRKRGSDEFEESGNQCCAPTAVREKKGSKQLERPTRCYPLTSSETVIGGPDRHSASLAALLAPIRGVFISEDPATELVNTATSYVGQLLELTEKNDGSLFPHAADIPVARRELYKKMWWELKRLAKRTRKDKTQGQEDLAQAIRAARADFKTSEQQLPQPLPALTDKPTEHVHINKRRRCEEVPRDIQGRPIFPIKLGPSLQVYDLGSVVWNRPAFHNEKYIWPAGYKSRRAYASMLNSENRIFYWCEIMDDGQAPEFRLTPEDDETNPVIGISATAVWTVVVKRVGALRLEEGGKKTFANVSGPEYFGFANPTIARLIQQLPNAERCAKYKRQDYFPNVPMRAVELDAWQGIIANECASSPQRKESTMEGKDNTTQLHSPHEQGGDHEMTDIGDRGDQGGAVVVPEEDEVGTQKRGCGSNECELRGMSWDSEEFRKALARRGKLGLAEFSRQFLLSNSGSLFGYYWSAKLKRATDTIELDGRK